MAIRQYIGARYVPRFMGTYVPTQNYEALDVVDNGLGTSYIAKVPTPAGTPLTNTTYWAIYGATSGAIINLQNQIDNINDDITNLEQYVTNRKVVMITDSYGNRQNASGKTVKDILTDRGHNIVYDVALSGGAFCQANLSLRFSEYLDDYTGNHNEVTDVLFCGGINDRIYTYNTIVSDVIMTIQAAKTQYPNAKIHIIPWGASFDNTLTSVENMFLTVPYAYSEGAISSGALIAENAQYILRNSKLFQSDLVHPNADGVDALAGQLDTYLRGGTIDVQYILDVSVSLYSGVSDVSLTEAKNLIMRRHNGNVTICSKTGGWGFTRFSISTTPAPTGFVNYNPLFELDETLLAYPQNLGSGFWIPLHGIAIRSGGSLRNIGGTLNMLFYGRYIRCMISANDYSDVQGFYAIDNTIMIND